MERLRSYKEMEPTYGELEIALKKLNYENKSTSKIFVFINEEFDSVVAIPIKGKQEKVDKSRFAMISHNMEGLGIIKHRDDLAKMIEQNRLQEKEAAA